MFVGGHTYLMFVGGHTYLMFVGGHTMIQYLITCWTHTVRGLSAVYHITGTTLQIWVI
jgi:hypothetical protein